MSTPTVRWPDFAPLKLEFDGIKMSSELSAANNYFIKTGTGQSLRHKPQVSDAVCSAEELLQVAYHGEDEEGHYVQKDMSIPSWRVVNLKRLEGDLESQWGDIRYLGYKPGQWFWNPNFIDDMPTIKETVEKLPFEYVDRVIVLAIPPDGMGPFHQDAPHSDYWDVDGNLAISLVLTTGETPFVIHHGGQDFYTNERAFLFKDCFFHGVPKTKDWRVVIRVFGKPDISRLNEFIIPGKEIWFDRTELNESIQENKNRMPQFFKDKEPEL